MKASILFFAGLCFAASAHSADLPAAGKLIELHSCELYTGGCVASSESTLQGRISVTAWSFERGVSQGTRLEGLQAVLLQVADDNLAAKSAPSKAVVYLPENVTKEQESALLAWVRKEVPQSSIQQVRKVPISLNGDGVNLSLLAGSSISLQSGPLLPCGMGSCGESLWYSPQVSAEKFTVAMSEQASVMEEALQLTWRQSGSRNVFVGRFDEDSSAKAKYSVCHDSRLD